VVVLEVVLLLLLLTVVVAVQVATLKVVTQLVPMVVKRLAM
jgi:hypothetical protein